MMVANLGTLSGQSLPFGAWLTKIFKAHHVNLEGEVDVKITSPISEYTLTRAGGAENLLGSINFENEPIPDEEEPNDNAMPPNEQPQYWTDYLALEQEQYNQRLQWEQQMANQVNTLDSRRRDEVTSNRIDQIDHRVTQVYHHYFPPLPPPPDNDA
ncbi:hypothetical protein ACSBR2_040072 [Camellia fascicularis]